MGWPSTVVVAWVWERSRDEEGDIGDSDGGGGEGGRRWGVGKGGEEGCFHSPSHPPHRQREGGAEVEKCREGGKERGREGGREATRCRRGRLI